MRKKKEKKSDLPLIKKVSAIDVALSLGLQECDSEAWETNKNLIRKKIRKAKFVIWIQENGVMLRLQILTNLHKGLENFEDVSICMCYFGDAACGSYDVRNRRPEPICFDEGHTQQNIFGPRTCHQSRK